MNEPNMQLNKSKLTVNQQVCKLANDHPVITTLAIVTAIVGLAVLLSKAKNYSDIESGRYTEFDTNY